MNWLFIDMNSYFASVEQHCRPELRGLAIGVVPVESDSTAIIAASYPAKKFGVKTGTRVYDAKRLCPGIRLVKARPALYVKVHHAILRAVDECAPIHKVYSIDEWAIRLIGKDQQVENAVALGRQIKRKIHDQIGPVLTCSVGIATSRLLAKIASDLQKPDGLTVLSVDDLPSRLSHFSLTDLCGIGKGMVSRLHGNGVLTVADLWGLSKQRAVEIWGSVSGGQWWAGFHGHDEPEVPTRRSSMTHANVLAPQFRNEESAHGILTRLICRLGVRLRKHGYVAQRLSIHVNDIQGGHYTDFSNLAGVQDTPTLLKEFEHLWARRAATRRGTPLKIGADVSGLVPQDQVSGFLFDEIEKPRRLSVAIDKINQRWGSTAIFFGGMHGFRHKMEDKIAFGRIPDEV